jgi:hypothetical protein
MCLLVAVELAYMHESDRYASIILLQIILISINLRAGLYYEYPGLYASDPYFWVNVVTHTLESGSIISGSTYTYYPIFSIILSVTSLLASITIKNAMFISVGLLELFGVVFVYFIGNNILSNTKLGLLSALLLGISQFHIRMGVVIFQSTIALAMYPIIIYLLLKKTHNKDWRFAFLLLLLLFIFIITHHLSSMILLLSFIFIFIGEFVYTKLYNNNSDVNNGGNILQDKSCFTTVVITLIGIISYWIYNHSWQLKYAINSIFKLFSDVSHFQVEQTVVPVSYNVVATAMDRFGMILPILLFIIGSLYWLNLKNINKTKSMLIFGGGLLTIATFAFISFGYKGVIVNRWFPFIYVLISTPAALGIYYITQIFDNVKYKKLIYFLLIFVFSTVMITTGMEDIDDSIYDESQLLHRYTKSDIITADKIININNNDTLTMDSRYTSYFLGKNITNLYGNIEKESTYNKNKLWIVRQYYLDNYKQMVLSQSGIREKNEIINIEGLKLANKFDRNVSNIYNSGMIKVYH